MTETARAFSNSYIHPWLLQEEIANSISHGIGALLGIAALVLLIINASEYGTAKNIVSGALFGSSLIIAYLSSTLYHAILVPKAKRILRIVDHSCIYLLIAGSYTPFTLITLHGPLGWTLFGLTWGIACIGILQKVFFIDHFAVLSTVAYLAMGWIGVFTFSPIYHHLALMGIAWVVLGGLFYSLGVIFFFLERVPFFHTIWHLFVLSGSICHFFAILYYVMPISI